MNYVRKKNSRQNIYKTYMKYETICTCQKKSLRKSQALIVFFFGIREKLTTKAWLKIKESKKEYETLKKSRKKSQV